MQTVNVQRVDHQDVSGNVRGWCRRSCHWHWMVGLGRNSKAEGSRSEVRVAIAEVQTCFLDVRRFLWPTLVSVHGSISMRVCFHVLTKFSREVRRESPSCASVPCLPLIEVAKGRFVQVLRILKLLPVHQ